MNPTKAPSVSNLMKNVCPPSEKSCSRLKLTSILNKTPLNRTAETS